VIQSALSGLIQGGGYAFLAVCIVITYRMVRVLNFAQAAIGAMGAYVAIVLSEQGWAYLPALLVGVLAAVALGALCGFSLVRWFSTAPIEQRSTVAIAMLIALLAIGQLVFGTHLHKVPVLLPGKTFEVASVIVTWSSVVVVVAAIILAAVVSLFLQRTRIGTKMRAQASRPQTAELLGVPAKTLGIAVWAITGGIAAAGILVIAPSTSNEYSNLGLLVMPAIAGAAVGLFRNTWLAIAGGVGIGLLAGLAGHWPSVGVYSEAIPLLVIVLVIVWSQRGSVWDAAR
jgi:branched-chain amino acid transport system permease protein